MNRLLDTITRRVIRSLFPGIAQSLEEEGQFDFRDKTGAGREVDVSRYVECEDHGADTTVVCFAGMAALYAAMPRFEFRKTLSEAGGTYNFVWVRDVHRSSYNFAPDGSGDGPSFYARVIGEALERMGSKHVVAIGASGGGAAALAFSGVLPIDHVITFNPAFPFNEYSRVGIILRELLDWRKFVWARNEYFEVLLVTLSTRYMWRRNCRLVGRANVMDTLDWYRRKSPPARATVFYSEGCVADAWQIEKFDGLSRVELHPVASGRHNCMGELKDRGELAGLIRETIRAGVDGAGA